MKSFYLFIAAMFLSATSFAIGAITGTTNICAGTTSLLSNTTTGGTWSSSATAVVTIGSATGIMAGVAAGIATITYDDGTMIATVTATVNATVYLSDSIVVSPNDTICQGGLATFTVLPTLGGPSPSFSWIVNGAPHGTGTTLSYVPDSGDVVFCVMTTSEQCPNAASTYSNVIVMTTVTSKEPVFTISASPPQYILARQNDTLTVHVVYDGSVPSYQWLVKGVPVPGATAATYIFNCESCYDTQKVSCIVTGCGGASKEGKIAVLVGEGVALLNAAHGGVSISPNPNNGVFSINSQAQLKTNDAVTVSVINMYGAEVYRKKVLPRNRMLNEQIAPETQMAKGVYILKLSSSSENIMQRFIVD
ncbi:MAG: hypothetical protein JWQ38_3005 [Flavipsychrobacter sp.]|nr:hypothetical protein [Flavipsychrobacter sp.]